MNQEQLGQFCAHRKVLFKAKWENVTVEDLTEVCGRLEKLDTVLQGR